MMYCSAINNTQGKILEYGIVYSNSPLNIYDLCVTENNADHSNYGNGNGISIFIAQYLLKKHMEQHFKVHHSLVILFSLKQVNVIQNLEI